MLRKIFESKWKKVPGRWRKQRNEELHESDGSPYFITAIKSRRMKLSGNVACMEEIRNVYRVMVRKAEGNRPCGRRGRRWDDNIKMSFTEIGWDSGLDSFGFRYGSMAGCCKYINETSA